MAVEMSAETSLIAEKSSGYQAFADYDSYRAYRYNDPAWQPQFCNTSSSLKNGDTCLTVCDTAGQGRSQNVIVPAGTLVTLVNARTPCVVDRGMSVFANADTADGFRIRVPHGALRKA